MCLHSQQAGVVAHGQVKWKEGIKEGIAVSLINKV
jgi:hypothetical protein